jgi:membrane protein
VRRHVVGALVVVFPGPRFRRQIRQKTAEVAQHGGVGIFLNDQAGRGVLHENRTQPGADFTTRNRRVYLGGDVPQTCSTRAEFERFLVQCHALWYAIISSFAPDLSMGDGSIKSSVEASPQSGRWERVSTRAAQAFSAKPWSHKLWLVGRGLVTRDTLQAASAMAFDLFMAAIPMLALAGWLFASVSSSSDAVLLSTSLLVDLTPQEVRSLIWSQLGRFSVTAVAPVALLGALWLASSAFNTLMGVLEVTVLAQRRPWWKRRLLALGCVVSSILLFTASATLAVNLAGGPSTVVRLIARGDFPFLDRASHFLLLGLVLAIATALLAGFFRIAVIRPFVRRRVWPGAIVSILASGSASLAFAYYASHLARFALFYGTLSAVAIVLGWLWLMCLTLLLGAELNLQLEDLSAQPPLAVPPTHTPQPSGSSDAA